MANSKRACTKAAATANDADAEAAEMKVQAAFSAIYGWRHTEAWMFLSNDSQCMCNRFLF